MVKEKITEVINDLKDIDLVSPLLDNIKDRHRIALIRRVDDKFSLFHEFYITQLEIDITEEEYYNKLLKITPEDISLFIDRLVLDTIYFLKEGEADE